MAKERDKGIFINPREFRSESQIKLDLIRRGELPTLTRTEPVLVPRPLADHLQTMEQRGKEVRDSESPRHIEVTLPRDSTIVMIGDQHIGNAHTDHKRILAEVEAIKNSPDTYVIFLGDSVDGIFWGGESGGEQVGSLDEQTRTRRAMFRELRGRVIAGFGGEHDSKWTAKSGPDAMDDFSELTNAPYIHGTGEIVLNVGKQQYNIIAAHKLRGSSIYNNNHPQFRADREIAGADIIVSAHTHRKAVTQQPARRFGKAQLVTHISVGSYKRQDRYAQREGYPEQQPEQMYGVAIRVHAKEKRVDVDPDIINGIMKWNR